MAPTKRKLQKTKVGEQVLDLVIPYIHNVEDRNSVSLVSHKFYEIDGITRKRLTVHTSYYPNPPRLSKRFPFIESLTLKGPPSNFNVTDAYDTRIIPWIQQLALEFRCLKELYVCGLVVLDDDLETLARKRGKDLRSLKINKCKRFSTNGLRHVSKYCNQLRTFCLENSDYINMKDGIWLHQLALNSTVLERLHVTDMDFFDVEDLTLVAKNCCKSLISLKIGACYLSKLGDAFRYAVRLEHFGGDIYDEESELVNVQLPLNMRSLSGISMSVTRYSSVLPLLNQITKLELFLSTGWRSECHCLVFKRCPNLEDLYTSDECGDKGLKVIGRFCKKLRKLTYNEDVTHVGLIALVKGCTNLECLDFSLTDISNEALECVGTYLKNLRDFRILLRKKDGTPLDNVLRAMLMGCSKLERLDIWHGGLTDVGLEYIGKYGANLRFLHLTRKGNSNAGLVKLSNAGLVKLSEGCPNLRKLKLRVVIVIVLSWHSLVQSFNFETLGHDILMAPMLTGAAIMDGALLQLYLQMKLARNLKPLNIWQLLN